MSIKKYCGKGFSLALKCQFRKLQNLHCSKEHSHQLDDTCTRDLNAARGADPSALLLHEIPLHLGSYGAQGRSMCLIILKNLEINGSARNQPLCSAPTQDYFTYVAMELRVNLDAMQIKLSWIEYFFSKGQRSVRCTPIFKVSHLPYFCK